MQTFLPYPDYARSMHVLDASRLGNQVYRECITLLRGGWPNHPASRMWRGHFHHLALYAMAGIEELVDRGQYYPETRKELEQIINYEENTGPPPWFGDKDFHASHRSNLLRKNSDWYGQFGWSEPHDLPYVWPQVPIVIPVHTPSALFKGKKL